MARLIGVILFALIGILIVMIWLGKASTWQAIFFRPTPISVKEEGPAPLPAEKTTPTASQPQVEVLAENLQIPWEIAWLPDGDMLVTERPGRLLRIGQDRQVVEVSGVEHVGEGGLMGMSLHPQFTSNQWLYLYLTTRVGDGLQNRLERYKLVGNQLQDRQVLLEGIKGASIHDGGRLRFGPDNKLYLTTGDAGETKLAQEVNALNGKILRLNDDGTIPADNPFGTLVYSYGHRNSQGLAWDDQGRLWATEHGRSGIQSGFDELNLIEPDKNYGWPVIEGDETAAGMVTPVIQSGANETWAPAGAAYRQGSIWFVGLRGETLYEYQLTTDNLTRHFAGQFGRLRAVAVGPDGALYVTTSNTDGRGQPRAGDDKVIRLVL